MGTNIPDKKEQQIVWFENHWPLSQSSPEKYGLTDAQFSVIAVATPGMPSVVIDRIAYTPYGESTRTLRSDVNGDGVVNKYDFDGTIQPLKGTVIGNPAYRVEADLDRDGKITSDDYDVCIADDGQKSGGGVGEAGLFSACVRNSVGYCGYIYNEETGLYTVRYRTYSAVLGRWLTRDPAGYVDGMGLYEYVAGQPTLLLDPEGLSPISWLLKKCGAGVAKKLIKDSIKELVEKKLKKLLKGKIKNKIKQQEVQELLDLAQEIEDLLDASGGSLAWNLFTMVPVVGDVCDIVDTCKTISKVREKLADLDKRYGLMIKRLRDKGVSDAWKRERENLAAGKKGSREWTDQQRRDILEGRTPEGRDGKPIEGQHKQPVEDHPDLADDPDNIESLDWPDHLDAHGKSPRK